MKPLGTILPNACPECGADMILRDSRYGLFYGCTRYPACTGTHGAHPDGKPLGTPANKETRLARTEAHNAFDRLWKGGYMSRKRAYKWLARKFKRSEVHIGEMDIPSCRLVVQWSEQYIRHRQECNQPPVKASSPPWE